MSDVPIWPNVPNRGKSTHVLKPAIMSMGILTNISWL